MHRSKPRLAIALILALAVSYALLPIATATPARADEGSPGAVYAMTNDAAGNKVLAYRRASDGALSFVGAFATGGLGTSHIRLSSQGSVLLSRDGRWLFVANVGSNDISVFQTHGGNSDGGNSDGGNSDGGNSDGGNSNTQSNNGEGLTLVDRVPSGGLMPNSLTLDGHLLYVLNNGGDGVGNITAFTLERDGRLTELPGSTRPLSGAGTNPAQVGFSPDGRALVVTEKATNQIDTFAVDQNGYASGPAIHPSSGVTPFGFAFNRQGDFVVTEAFNGVIGQAAASSYALSGPTGFSLISSSVPDTQSEVCWALITKDNRFAYITNFGSGTISSYNVAPDGQISVHSAIAATTTPGQRSIRDEAFSRNGRYLYAIDITAQKVFAWQVQTDGSLTPLGAFAGLPPTVAGIAAS